MRKSQRVRGGNNLEDGSEANAGVRDGELGHDSILSEDGINVFGEPAGARNGFRSES